MSQKKKISKKYFMSFLPHQCHSFHISVIPSVLLSFLPDYFHSFRITVIPSVLVSFLLNVVIPSELLPFQIFFILNSSGTLPYPKGEKIGQQSRPYLQVFVKYFLSFSQKNLSPEKTKCLVFNFCYAKEAIWHLAIWQNWCFGQFHHSKIEK